MSQRRNAGARLGASLPLLMIGHAVCASGASAETVRDKFYASAGFGLVAFDAGEVDVNLGEFQVRLGYLATPHFGVEIEGALPIHDEKQSENGTSIHVRKDSSIAAFGIARFPISETVTLHGRLGYRQSDFSVKAVTLGDPVVRQSASDGGVVLGAGAQYAFGVFDFRADYARTEEGTPFASVKHVNELSFSIVTKF